MDEEILKAYKRLRDETDQQRALLQSISTRQDDFSQTIVDVGAELLRLNANTREQLRVMGILNAAVQRINQKLEALALA